MAVDIVNEAIALIGAGKMAAAQARLEPFIEANPHHIAAWLCEAETWPAVGGKVKVLELALQHNPGDPQLLSAWDFVVLQEQSQIPASATDRSQAMYPAVRQLVGQLRTLKAQRVLFMTWGHRDGWPEAGLPDYNAMQSQLSAGYLGVARELNVPVAPVGAAWQAARTQAPALNLWMDDGTHPNSAGTYLAACVFYAALFRQSPAGLPYRADLPPETAQILQRIAADSVLKNPGQWYLH